jgi:hypothetical protein
MAEKYFGNELNKLGSSLSITPPPQSDRSGPNITKLFFPQKYAFA